MKTSSGPRRGRRRGGRWVRVSHGLYRPAHDVDGVREDLEAWRLVLPPSGTFTHLTAAGQYGWWLPPLPDDLPVFVSMLEGESRPRREGLVVSRHAEPIASAVVDGLPLASPEETLLACARDLGLLDMVVLVDAALHMRTCTRGGIAAVAALRRRGAPRLRTALALADGRSESAWETMLRMLHTACGVPVEPQYRVYDKSGLFVCRGDLRILGTQVIHEYDGGEHRKVRRHRTDLRRERRIGHTPWTRRGYTSQEVLKQAAGILRDADDALGRPHRPERVRKWHRLVADSLFTPSGIQRLRRRLHLLVDRAETGHDRPSESA